MKKILICLLVFLLVLVSCTTKSVKSEAPAVEVVEATAVESPAPEVPVVTPDPAPEVQAEPVHEEKTGEGVEVLPEKEVEPEVSPEEAAVAEEVVETIAEDWSKTITAAAPEAQQSAAPAASEKKEPEQPASSVTSKTTAAPTAAKETTQKSAPAATSTASEKKSEEGFFKKIGNFIANQKLLSIGILTCLIGFIYLVVALILSSRPRKVKVAAPVQEAEEASEPDVEPQTDIEEALRIDSVPEEVSGKPAKKPADSKPENDDDAFLRSLLGEDKK